MQIPPPADLSATSRILVYGVTGSGKIRRQKTGLRHNLEKKASKVTRRMSGTTEVAKADVPRAKKLLGL